MKISTPLQWEQTNSQRSEPIEIDGEVERMKGSAILRELQLLPAKCLG